MKAILVIDNPNNCYECPCYKKGRTRYECSAYLFNNNRILIIDDLSNKPNDCPLKPTPQKKTKLKGRGKDSCEYSLLEQLEYRKGFNDCLDEILGAEE